MSYQFLFRTLPNICDTLRDLVPFVQLKNVRNTHKGVLLLVKPAILLKLTFLLGSFSRFLNCTSDTKSQKTSHMMDYFLRE